MTLENYLSSRQHPDPSLHASHESERICEFTSCLAGSLLDANTAAISKTLAHAFLQHRLDLRFVERLAPRPSVCRLLRLGLKPLKPYQSSPPRGAVKDLVDREVLAEAKLDDDTPEFSNVRTTGEAKLVAKAIIANPQSKPRSFVQKLQQPDKT